MAHHINDLEPSPNLTAKDKGDIVKATAEAVKADLEKIAGAYAKDKEDLAAALGTLRESVAKMVTAEVAKQLKTPADVARAQDLRAKQDREEAENGSGDEQRVQADETRLAVDRAEASKNEYGAGQPPFSPPLRTL